ncbi:MAG TPA: MarR family transcriptional regulator [Candidatus Angelobacter sp.]|nr:MarR family transcriptional regulator [Candidatus Angelobacter sp.]
MSAAPKQCARELLEAVPPVMRFIRGYVRRHPAEGLLVPQFRALSFLGRTRDASLSAVAEHLGVSLPAMSRLMNGLVNGGWVKRETVSENRRQVALALTARGRADLEKLRGQIRRQLSQRLSPLSAEERKTICSAMQLLRQTFEPQSAGKPNKA